MNAEDMRRYLDSLFEKLSPAKAQEIAKGLLGDDRREQAQKLAGELIESAQRNRDRVRELISREVTSQMKNVGVATDSELEALNKRVRDLERAAGKTASTSKPAARKPSARKTASVRKPSTSGTAAGGRKPTERKSADRNSAARKTAAPSTSA